MRHEPRTSFSANVLADAFRRVEDSSVHVAGWKDDDRFQRLQYLRDELLALQNDINRLGDRRRAEPPRLILVTDDTPIKAYASLQNLDVERFSFPLGGGLETFDDRAEQYLFRTDRMFRTGRYPVIATPPTIDGCLSHLQYFVGRLSHQIRTLDFGRILTEIGKVEGSRRSYPQLLTVRDGLQLDNELVPLGSLDSEDRNKQQRIDENSRSEMNAAVGIGAVAALLSESGAIKRLRRVLGRSSLIRFVQDFVPSQFDLHRLAPESRLEAFRADVVGLVTDHGIARYEPILQGLIEMIGRVNRVADAGSDDQWLWRSASAATYVHALNDIARRHEIDAEFQLVTHRSLLATAVRAMPESELLVPIRHPKFLAAQMPASLIGEIASDVDQITTEMAGFIKTTLDRREIVSDEVDKFISRIQKSWIALKRPVYSAEAGFSKDKYKEELERRSSSSVTKERLRAFLEPLAIPDSDPSRLLATDLKLKTKSLLSVFLHSIPGPSTIAALKIDERARDPEHWMLLPNSGALRYVLKLPDIRWMVETVGGTDRAGTGTAFPIELKTLLDRYGQLADVQRWFVLALVCAVLGNWRLVDRYLADEEFEKTTDRKLRNESRYLRCFALRAMAAERTPKSRAATELLKDAYAEAVRLTAEDQDDLRFQLNRIGTALEVLALADDPGPDAAVLADGDDKPAVLALRCSELISNVALKLAREPQVCDGQRFYWNYLTARASQMQFMAYGATWGGWTPNPADHYLQLAATGQVDWLDSFECYDKAWRECSAIGAKTGLLRPDPGSQGATDRKLPWDPRCPVRPEYPAAVFLWHFAKLRFKLHDGEMQDLRGSRSGDDRLLDVAENTAETLRCLAGMEEACRRLSFNGFPRRLFRHIKRHMYELAHGNLHRDLGHVFFKLKKGLAETL